MKGAPHEKIVGNRDIRDARKTPGEQHERGSFGSREGNAACRKRKRRGKKGWLALFGCLTIRGKYRIISAVKRGCALTQAPSKPRR